MTTGIPFWTSIQPIYLAHAAETAGTASYLQEVSGGRFRLGLGVSHGTVHQRLGVEVGRPLADIRQYVSDVRAVAGEQTPPIYLATMRDRMLGLAVEIADGAIWANAARSAMATSSPGCPAPGRTSFFRANMIPTVIDDDRGAADAVNRRTMSRLPVVAELSQLLARCGLRRGDGGRRGRLGRRRAGPAARIS